MNLELSRATVAPTNANASLVRWAEAKLHGSIEQVQAAYLSRRLRIAPSLAPIVARLAFGEGRPQ